MCGEIPQSVWAVVLAPKARNGERWTPIRDVPIPNVRILHRLSGPLRSHLHHLHFHLRSRHPMRLLAMIPSEMQPMPSF